MTSKPSVVLLGFFGRGNVGDEAFLHVQYELLKDDYNIILPIERYNAVPGFHTWEPYNRCEVINYDDVTRIYGKDVVGMNIGGGSLPFAFSGQFLLTAFDTNIRTTITGIDTGVKAKSGPDQIRRDIYHRLDFLSVRSKKSWLSLTDSGIKAHRGADWALGLKGVETPHSRRKGALVVLRDFGEPQQHHLEAISRLENYLKRQGHQVRYLPFSRDDSNAMASYKGLKGEIIGNVWHDPRQALDAISNADVVVSVGRLHALIMPMTLGVPVIAIDPNIPAGSGIRLNAKNLVFCLEFGVPFFYNVDEMISEYGNNFNNVLKKRTFSENYWQRYGTMEKRFKSVMAGEHSDEAAGDTTDDAEGPPAISKKIMKELANIPLQLRLGS